MSLDAPCYSGISLHGVQLIVRPPASQDYLDIYNHAAYTAEIDPTGQQVAPKDLSSNDLLRMPSSNQVGNQATTEAHLHQFKFGPV